MDNVNIEFRAHYALIPGWYDAMDDELNLILRRSSFGGATARTAGRIRE